ncbi:histidine kinase [Streptomyces pathocidini]|uniref:histidine kinase n=1 Tax=Streptomyces pathocidini TaxID=1650571 RepID=UPI003F4CAF10
MHDVLAHRLSLLSIHAGALQVAPDAPAPDIQRATGVIWDSAHQALEDLREITGVLHASSLAPIGKAPTGPRGVSTRFLTGSRVVGG